VVYVVVGGVAVIGCRSGWGQCELVSALLGSWYQLELIIFPKSAPPDMISTTETRSMLQLHVCGPDIYT
jgi:hypothetical protein